MSFYLDSFFFFPSSPIETAHFDRRHRHGHVRRPCQSLMELFHDRVLIPGISKRRPGVESDSIRRCHFFSFFLECELDVSFFSLSFLFRYQFSYRFLVFTAASSFERTRETMDKVENQTHQKYDNKGFAFACKKGAFYRG